MAVTAADLTTALEGLAQDEREERVEDFVDDVQERIQEALDVTTRLFPPPGNSAAVRSNAEAAVLSLSGLVEDWAERGQAAVDQGGVPSTGGWRGWFRAGEFFAAGAEEIAGVTFDPAHNAVNDVARVTTEIVTTATETAGDAGRAMWRSGPAFLSGVGVLALAVLAYLFYRGAA